MEQFKQIPSMPLYEAGDLGTIRNAKTKRVKAVSTWNHNTNKKSHIRVQFGYSKTQQNKLVHRLIAETWIPNSRSVACVDHISGITTNNSVGNLQWVSQQENQRLYHLRKNLGNWTEKQQEWAKELTAKGLAI